jgi:hypothetical protein
MLTTRPLICSPSSGWLIALNLSLVQIAFHLFFTLIVLSDVDLHFSLMLVKETSAVEEETI